MTSREHARRLMLILLSSQSARTAAGGSTEPRTSEPADDRQATDGRDDSTEGDERRTTALIDALILT